jgi:hypothetical protein
MDAMPHRLTDSAALGIQAIAITITAPGAIDAVVAFLRGGLHSCIIHVDRRAVWLSFARVPVVGLVFERAADIMNKAFSQRGMSWTIWWRSPRSASSRVISWTARSRQRPNAGTTRRRMRHLFDAAPVA